MKYNLFLNQPLYFIKVRKVKSPIRSYKDDAGIDFYIPENFKTKKLKHGESILIPSGLKIIVPKNFALIFFNRSSVASKLNLYRGACVVDSGFRGEVLFNLINNGNEEVEIKAGMKIIQGVLIPVGLSKIIEITEDEFYKFESDRNEKGFGSTNI